MGDGSPPAGSGAEPPVPQKLKLFCETTHNICIKIQQTTVAVTLADILNITSKILGGGHYHGCPPPLHKYWGDMSPLSHRDRHPWTCHIITSAYTPGTISFVLQVWLHAIHHQLHGTCTRTRRYCCQVSFSIITYPPLFISTSYLTFIFCTLIFPSHSPGLLPFLFLPSLSFVMQFHFIVPMVLFIIFCDK